MNGGNEEDEDRTPTEDDEARSQAFLHHLIATMMMNRGPGRGGNSNSNDDLVRNLRISGVLNNDAVETALRKIPRGLFVPDDLQDAAYVDSPLRLPSFGFNISAPHMYAICLEALQLEPGNTFLDIGSGCGHLTALGAYLVGPAGRADGIDLLPEYIAFAEQNVKKLKEQEGLELTNITFEIRNCFIPDINERKYDRIHVGACLPTARKDALLELLKNGGILVTPFEDSLVKFTKDKDGNVTSESLTSVRYGDLKVPSDAEIKEATLALERKRATTIVVPEDTFVSDFTRLINNRDMSDIVFVVEGQRIYAHKFILQVRSQHFKAMLTSGLRESRDSEIPLPDTNLKAFLGCLRFIYTGYVPIPDADAAVELIEEADKLQLGRLKAQCEEVISKGLDVENAAYIYQVASHHNAMQLRRLALDLILNKFAEVSKTKCFAEMDRELVVEVTQEACKILSKTLPSTSK